jgi:superfamily II DNA or RNA helicase
MPILQNDAAKAREIVLPEVWEFTGKHKNFQWGRLAKDTEQVGCTAVVLQNLRGTAARISIGLADGRSLLLTRKVTGELFEQSEMILVARDFSIDEGVVTVSKDARWHKHPALMGKDAETCVETIRKSWAGALAIKEELRDSQNNIVQTGLRRPQVGALHAVAAHWIVSTKPALVVMPTGTGKTEVMLASMLLKPVRRLLVLVPSDALRHQTGEKFTRLGVLSHVGVIGSSVLRPVTGLIKSGFKSQGDLKAIARCNVVVSTVAALQGMTNGLLKKFLDYFDSVFFDEAHHMPALSWDRIFDFMTSQRIVQFTATPFRLDGMRIPGRIIFNFPLRYAQQDGYFRPIHFRDVFETDPDQGDQKVAELAVQQLRQDLAAGYDHFLLARAESIERAEKLLTTIYAQRYGDLNPVLAHSKRPGHKAILDAIRGRQHRIIVCVNMFGEGFDFPGLKIAAVHDPHKSLAITLQFTGRFTRDAKNIGEATLVANTADTKVSEAIEELYAEDSDWNQLIPELSSKAVQSQQDFSDFLDKMKGGEIGDDEIFGLNVLRPKTSTVIFKASAFNPRRYRQGVKKKGTRVEREWHSKDKDLVVFITRSRVPIEWATIKETANETWTLYIVAYEQQQGLIFVYSSDKGSLHHEIARAVSGGTAELVSGERMFRALHGFSRLVFMSAGLYGQGKRLRFRMYTGLDIGEAIDPTVQSTSTKSNLFAIGYDNGERTSIGVSYKGRVWSMSSSSVPDWRHWCNRTASKILDETIPTDQFLSHTLLPKEIRELPNKNRLLSVTLPIEWYSSEVDSVRIYEADAERKFDAFGIHGFTRSDDLVEMEVGFSEGASSRLRLSWGPGDGQFSVVQRSGPTLRLFVNGKHVRLDEYFRDHPPILIFADGSEVRGGILLAKREDLTFTYDKARIQVLNWAGVDLCRESKWKGGSPRGDSIQGYLIDSLKTANNTFVVDDDDSGEIADVVEISEQREEVIFRFYHCKYAGGTSAGKRADDLYVVCGQAVRSVRWVHDHDHLIRHMQRRELKNLNGRPTRFEKGNLKGLLNLKRRLKRMRVRYEIVVVQPGLSKTSLTPELSAILGAASVFVSEITGSALEVIASA